MNSSRRPPGPTGTGTGTGTAPSVRQTQARAPTTQLEDKPSPKSHGGARPSLLPPRRPQGPKPGLEQVGPPLGSWTLLCEGQEGRGQEPQRRLHGAGEKLAAPQCLRGESGLWGRDAEGDARTPEPRERPLFLPRRPQAGGFRLQGPGPGEQVDASPKPWRAEVFPKSSLNTESMVWATA